MPFDAYVRKITVCNRPFARSAAKAFLMGTFIR